MKGKVIRLPTTNTTRLKRASVAAYRYSTSDDYRTFNDHIRAKTAIVITMIMTFYNIDDYYRDFGRKIAYPPIFSNCCRKD